MINQEEKQKLRMIAAATILLQLAFLAAVLFWRDVVLPEPSVLSALVEKGPYFFCLLVLAYLSRNQAIRSRIGPKALVCAASAALAAAVLLRLWLNGSAGTAQRPLWSLILPREIPVLLIFFCLARIKFSKPQ